MNSKTPFSLLAITILLASAAASPASVAQTIPEPMPTPEAAPSEVEPSAPTLCTWMDAGLAEHAPASNGATFLAFSTGTAAILFQASTSGLLGQTGPMQGCLGTNVHPCPEALASDIAYAVLKDEVLCYEPTQDSTPTDEALVEGICQFAASFSIFAPGCPAPPSPDGSEATNSPEPSGSEATQAEQDCPIEEVLTGLTGLTSSMTAAAPCLEDVTLPCEEQACEVDPCSLLFPQASTTVIDCLPCQPASECNPCSPTSECIPCPNGDVDQCVGPVCEGGGIGCLTDPCSDPGVDCPPCLENPQDCDLAPCNGTNCVAYVCGLIFSNEGCDVDPLDCGGSGEPDCVAWVCTLIFVPAQSEGDCGVSTCEDYAGNCIAFACDAALGNQDCDVPLPCGGSGQDDCLTWLCHTSGFQTGDCDPVELIGPLASFVVGAAVSCALGTPPPPGAPNCPFIINQVKAIVDDLIASLWPLVNDIAKIVLDCANGVSGPNACSDVRQASDDALQLVDELTLSTLGIAQQCLAELRGTVDADSPVDCERLGEPGAALQRYLDNVLLTFQEITAMAQACLDNAATSASCDAPCGEECTRECDLCQPCGPDGCGPPIPLARQAPRPELAPNMGRSFEATLPDSGVLPTQLGGDVDSDGIPDLLDAVNLPSEAQQWTGNDRLAVPQGLGQGGFLLLVEPSHLEAQLFLADTAPATIEGMDAAAALDILASKHGVALRNALATVLHENLTVHTTWVGIGAPIDQALSWSQTLPADGTWLMVRNDPTGVVSALRLGGLATPVAAPATSHYTALGLNDYRWEFLGLQGAGFCFDAAGLHGLVPCNGSPEPEWLRAYSGQAAYALRSLVAGLEARLVPVATDIETTLPAGLDSSQVNFRFPFPVTGSLPASDFQDRYDVDDDGRTTEGNGQADTVEPYLYVDPDENQAHSGDLFSGASAGWTLHVLAQSAAQPALTLRVGDVWGTPGKEFLVVQVADSLEATTVCAVRSGNGAAFYQGTARYRADAAQPCGDFVHTWKRLDGVGDALGGQVAGYAMTRDAPRQPLFKVLDADRNGLPDSIQINVPDPNSCGADTHSCTLYTTFAIPLTDAALPATPETPDVLPPPGPVYLGSPSQGNVDIFDPTSPLRLLGTESKRLTEGVGADYLLPMRGQGAPDVAVLQWPVPDGSSVSTAQPETRVFHFAGTYINMPAEPRDLVELSFLIQPADGNEAEQDFLLNGRILGSYLDVQSNETLVAQVDESHRDGFTQKLVDIDVDGYLDLIVHIPHFSQVKLVVKNSDEAASASFWDVQLTGGPLTGWVSGSYGAVYRLDDGILRRENVVGLPSNQRTLGMSMVSDNEFYVVTTGGAGSCGSGDSSPSIAHYVKNANSPNGFWSVKRLSQIGGGFNCNDLHDIWMNSAGTFGFAGGSDGLWLRYQNSQWQSLPRGTSCGIMDIEFNSSGVGYVAVAKADAESCPGFQGSPVMHWSGTAWSTQSVPASGAMYDVAPNGTYAVGFTNSVYSRSGTSWIKDYTGPQGSFLGVDQVSANEVWIAGVNQARCYTCTIVAVRSQGYWTSYDVNEGLNHLRGLDMYAPNVGAAVGNNALVIIQPPPRVDVYDTISPSSGLTSTTFTGQDTGSTSTAAGSLTHQWSWGDGTQSSGATASHKYSSLGWKEVTHTVTDSQGNTAQKVQQVFVDAQFMGTVSSSSTITVAGSMPSDLQEKSDQFRFSYSGNLWIKAELTAGDASLRLRGNLANFVEGAGAWPYEGARERSLEGGVPNGGTLYVAVDRPAGAPGGSYTLRLSEVAPTTLSSKLSPGTTPLEVTYLDRVRFSVTWTDAAAPSASPTLSFGSQTPVSMLAPTGALNYAAGVTYTYELPLTGGASYKPIYKATQGGVQHIDLGEPVMVTKEAVAYHNFNSDSQGSVPTGFNPATPPGKCCNYWHVENSNDAKFPSTVQLGRHGNVAWFAHKARGDYQSTSSQVPAGSLETPSYDLRLATRPTLSFASYYETEDLGVTDKMSVQVSHRDPNGGSWTGWQPLDTIDGHEGGYKQWRTQIIDLASYDDKLVKFQFKFEASAADNDFLGWMIDDVAIGTDVDADGLADGLERNRLAPVVTPTVEAHIPIRSGTGASAAVKDFQHWGAERILAEVLVNSRSANSLTLDFGVAPDWATDGANGSASFKQVLVSLPAGFSATSPQICEKPGSVQASDPTWYNDLGQQLFGSPYGFPNSPPAGWSYSTDQTPRTVYEKTNYGLRVQVDLTPCLTLLLDGNVQLTQAPMDLYVTVKGGTGSLDLFRVMAYGRTSALDKDSDQDGGSDAEGSMHGQIPKGSNALTTPFGMDADLDGTPAGFDPDDQVWVKVPAAWIDLSNQANTITFRLATDYQPTAARFIDTNGDTPKLVRHAQDGAWTTWVIQSPSSDSDITATWKVTGGTLDLILFRERENGFPVVQRVRHLFEGNGYSQTSDWEYDLDAPWSKTVALLIGGAELLQFAGMIKDAAMLLTVGVDAVPQLAVGYAFGEFVVEPVAQYAAIALKDGLVYKGERKEVGAVTHVDGFWRDPSGRPRDGYTLRSDGTQFQGGANLADAITFLRTQPPAVAGLGPWNRWIQQTGAQGQTVTIYMADSGGNVVKVLRMNYQPLAQMTGRPYVASDVNDDVNGAVYELLSVERALADQAYGKAHSNVKLPCHQVCFLPSTIGSQIYVDSGFVNIHEGPSNGERRAFGTWGLVPALRNAAYGNGQCCDRFMAENTLGLESVLYSYRMAQDSPNAKSSAFDAYWGLRGGNENCNTDLTQQRCRDLQLQAGVSARTTIEPFTVKWLKRGNTQVLATEAIGVGGQYWFRWGQDVEPADGKSRVERSKASTVSALDGYTFVGTSGVNAVAFDLTGPLGLEGSPTDPAWFQYHREDAAFSQAYQV